LVLHELEWATIETCRLEISGLEPRRSLSQSPFYSVPVSPSLPFISSQIALAEGTPELGAVPLSAPLADTLGSLSSPLADEVDTSG
jgi:hypothetical protein